jgi:hypothetical protein
MKCYLNGGKKAAYGVLLLQNVSVLLWLGMQVVKLGGPVYRIGVGGGSASSVEVREHILFFVTIQILKFVMRFSLILSNSSFINFMSFPI